LALRYDSEVEQRRQQLKEQVLPMLSGQMADRFHRLEQIRQQIGAQGAEGETWVREVLRKLDYLLEKFLQFASKDRQFRLYLQSVLDAERSSQQRTSGSPPVALDGRYDV
ncbi:MAG: hypothetical protein M3Y56_04900, partial [Armatimonadota bacterium]|nr:hypothetical protein [Armatimonadota bacterium]